MSDTAIAVVEPIRTRNIQIVMCVSIVTALLVMRCLPSTDDPSPAGILAPPLALLTVPHHLIVIILSFRQRRKLYTPAEIPNLVPMTAKSAVVLSSWGLCCFWLVVSAFYLLDLGVPRHKTLFVLTAIESGLVFAISAMCSRERLELLERRVEQPTSLVFQADDNGELTAIEGP